MYIHVGSNSWSMALFLDSGTIREGLRPHSWIQDLSFHYGPIGDEAYYAHQFQLVASDPARCATIAGYLDHLNPRLSVCSSGEYEVHREKGGCRGLGAGFELLRKKHDCKLSLRGCIVRSHPRGSMIHVSHGCDGGPWWCA